MSEAARNSVDIPLSKTLVALKRVRSLRDPATNSLSKYATALENMNWETSSNGVILELNESNDGNTGANVELGHSSRIPMPRNRKPSMVRIRGLNPTRTKLVHRARQDQPRNSAECAKVRHFSQHVEGVDFGRELQLESAEHMNVTTAKKIGCGNFAMSRVGSPCMSMSEARTNSSRRSTLGLKTEDTRVKSNDVVESNFSGCGISYCWSGTMKYQHANPYSDSDGQEQPLLSVGGTETSYRDVTLYSETPRNLSQKFRPRSFNELVGLNVVAQSLLQVSCNGKLAPIYLFHGPRGTGKTSTARIFAAALNCLSLNEQRPCGFCRECVLLFSGRSRDVKELDATKIGRSDRVKALLKSASLVPYTSRFKVFIIDECQALQEDAWSAILKSLDEPYRHAVYIMITSDLDEVPRSSMSRCQKYHFPKIKVADITCRLQRICVEEGLEYDKDALYFIAAKSNGSLRDAEMMLDQLGLLGKKITTALTHELIGSVCDDELIELLELALSSDTTNTVRRARELMGSTVDPLQLVSQLANLIMDALAGKCQSGFSEAGKNFFGRYALAEVGMRKLRDALKILSEAEKHLRTSKNQATWVTVALLQLGSGESSPPDIMNSSISHLRTTHLEDEWVSRENMNSMLCYACNHRKSSCSERHCRRLKLENIWMKAIETCQARSSKIFLRKEGHLLSVHVTEELAVAEVGFGDPDHLSRAEKLRTVISNSLQHVLGCNVETQLKLLPALIRRDTKAKRQSFSLLGCSGRKQEMSDSAMTDGDEAAKFQDYSLNLNLPDAAYCHDPKAEDTLRDCEQVVFGDDIPKICSAANDVSQGMNEEPRLQSSCFPKTLRLQRRLFSSDAAHTICLKIQSPNKIDLPTPKKAAIETYFCTYDPYSQCSRSTSHVTYSSREENGSIKSSRFGSKLLCWRTPKSSI